MESNLIAQLEDTRADLREALRLASALEQKFVGLRPKDSATGNPPQMDAVSTLLGEVRSLSGALVKALTVHHDLVGDFGARCQEAARPVGRLA